MNRDEPKVEATFEVPIGEPQTVGRPARRKRLTKKEVEARLAKKGPEHTIPPPRIEPVAATYRDPEPVPATEVADPGEPRTPRAPSRR